MIKYILAATILLVPITAQAQRPGHMHSSDMNHGMAALTGKKASAARPTEPGQAAFAAIQEIVGILERDPKVDWSTVNIEALREHLIDMNNVTLSSNVKSERIESGMRFTVTGQGSVQNSIRRMVLAHAVAMDGVGGWRFTARERDGGAILTVRVPSQDLGKLHGLGFMGVVTRGMHHQEHHLMIARGKNPHH